MFTFNFHSLCQELDVNYTRQAKVKFIKPETGINIYLKGKTSA